MTQSNIYMDFNATTPLDQEVSQHLVQWAQLWGNPSSIHAHGREAKKILRQSRRTLAELLGCHPLELIFTSGGSEANNLALKGFLQAHSPTPKRTRVLLGAIEHPSVLKQKPQLEALGYQVEIIPVKPSGAYDLEAYEKLLDSSVALVSVMLANNEVGVLAPLERMVPMAHQVGAAFHSDMVQALGKIPFDLKNMGVDMASFSSHKVYALKGAGLLYCRKGISVDWQIQGGGQERGRRAGTENLLAIASFAHMAKKLQNKPLVHLKSYRDHMETRLSQEVEGIYIIGKEQERLPNTSSFFIPGLSGESLLMNLDIRGFSVGTGAACSSGNPEPSPVLLAMGLRHEEAQSSLRVSLGASTTREQVDQFVDNLKSVVSHLRQLDHDGEKSDARKSV